MAGHVLTNRVVNPVLRPLLKGRPGRRLGRRLAVLRYTGRRTGLDHELVCQYVRSGPTAWVLVGRPEAKTWWRNLREPQEVDLWLAGEHLRARAVAVVGAERPDEVAAGLTTYLAGAPAARRALGLQPDRSAADVARGVCLVRVDLEP
ncbi:nitroreductase family deazaflavin-dependent oxidoreductase [Blastococcus sp. TML/M2B]|uniref:nitroreductase/quinone reductase family protein n=1 Tax=unclassified Blastococcus TaxID=2619396 RepID=UPI00190DA390|nr:MULTISPECIES: nitroreductase/quinone reductase family protein [unclassified Blastococcus]MBN1092677.1 nitroreductase family deazaflavin-dependent oxidoreductase [Blastococcus sp. TML/M2B]MBN1097214.1 nitroreductase family deazaflavin-dependent oxidoreductase [Blastococcus sp. TML/C7B]